MFDVLVIGWWTFPGMGATAGDLLSRDLACEWLTRAGLTFEVASCTPSRSEVHPDLVQPGKYTALLFVCGPIGNGAPLADFLGRFPHAEKWALNVTLLQDRSEWNPFSILIERDSSERVRPDITLGAETRTVPVIGRILVGSQPEYPTQLHERAESLLSEALQHADVAVVEIDTKLPDNAAGLQTIAQVETLISRMDAVITTRLHGAVFAIRRGVPPVVIDSIPGGSKLLHQMQAIGWPLAFDVATTSPAEVREALEVALSPRGPELAKECAHLARSRVDLVREEFLSQLRASSTMAGNARHS